MSLPKSYELQPMVNPEYRAPSPILPTSPARASSLEVSSPAVSASAIALSPTVSDLDLLEDSAALISEPQDVLPVSASEYLHWLETPDLEPHESLPKSSSEPDTDPGSGKSCGKSSAEPNLTPMTSNHVTRKSSRMLIPGSYVSSNADISEPEEVPDSPPDSAEASEQSPSPPKSPPPPPPKGSYAAVDRDVIYTCFLNGEDEQQLRLRFGLLRTRVTNAGGWILGARMAENITFTYYLPKKAKNPLHTYEYPSRYPNFALVQREDRPMLNKVESWWHAEGYALLNNGCMIFPNGHTRFPDGSEHDAFGNEINPATAEDGNRKNPSMKHDTDSSADRVWEAESDYSDMQSEHLDEQRGMNAVGSKNYTVSTDSVIDASHSEQNEILALDNGEETKEGTHMQETTDDKEGKESEEIFPLEDIDKV